MSLLIHPGFHKTGTTLLQATIFSDERYFNNIFSHEEVSKYIVEPHDFIFDKSLVKDEIKKRRELKSNSKPDIISSEILSGTRMTGQRESRSIADRLSECTGPAKILFTIRNQKQTLIASYLQFVKRGGRKTFKQFISYKPEPGFFFFDLSQLSYHYLVEYYAKVYGEANILVLPQEGLKENPVEFFDQLIGFATDGRISPGIDFSGGRRIGKSPPVSGLPFLKVASHFRRSPIDNDPLFLSKPIEKVLMGLGYRWTIGDIKAKRTLEAQARAVTGRRYALSNTIIQRFCPFDLSGLGYDMPGQVSIMS